jgi:HPt (histidine-containing phosphotransfer) domain-containing protein
MRSDDMPETIAMATFAELQEAAGADFVKELVQTFFEEAPVMLAELREAHAKGDVDGFRRAAHSLKSNGLTFGAQNFAAMARDLELEGLGASTSKAALDALQAEYERAAQALAALNHG